MKTKTKERKKVLKKERKKNWELTNDASLCDHLSLEDRRKVSMKAATLVCTFSFNSSLDSLCCGLLCFPEQFSCEGLFVANCCHVAHGNHQSIQSFRFQGSWLWNLTLSLVFGLELVLLDVDMTAQEVMFGASVFLSMCEFVECD